MILLNNERRIDLMKYTTPVVELMAVEAKDVITSSANKDVDLGFGDDM